jgi:uncharacterized repeat protein (TIGR02543 family)
LLYAGPVWDYDWSIGNGDLSVRNPRGFIANTESKGIGYDTLWFYYLYRNTYFYDRLQEIYQNVVLPQLNSLLEHEYANYVDYIYSASYSNYVRWNNEVKAGWHKELLNFDDNYTYIYTFLKERIDFLSSIWVDNEDYIRVKIDTQGVTRFLYYSSQRDKCFTELPLLVKEGYEFAGWYYSDTNEEFDQGIPLSEDIDLYAKWNYKQSLWTKIRINIKDYAFTIPILLFGTSFLIILIKFLKDIISRRDDKYGTKK